MESEVKTEDFKKVILCASKATSNKAIQPILNNILLSCIEGSMKISATDLDLSIECTLPAEVKEAGKITLPAKKLEEIITKVSGEDVDIKIEENNLTKITSNKSKFQINGVSAEEYPEIIKNTEEIKEIIEIEREELLLAINLTSFSTSKFDVTSTLSGVKFEITEKNFEMGSADGSRLSRFIGKIKNKSSKKSIILPLRSVIELERLLTVFSEVGNETIQVCFLPGQIIFQNKDFTLTTRIMEGKFPEYQNLIPEKQKYRAEFLKQNLLSALERVSILANERTSVVKMEIGKKENTAIFSAKSLDYGNATDEIDVHYDGEEINISFNYRFLIEALRNISSEKVILELNSGLSPIILKLPEKTNYDYTYLIMPMNIK